jgi:hypothetical protein
MLSTDRRYPQFWISNQGAPVQDNLTNSGAKTLIVQPKGWGLTNARNIQVEECDQRVWDVNNQCPLLANVPTNAPFPGLVAAELYGVDRTVKYDIYVSTSRVYVMLNDTPYSCTSLPAVADDGNTYTGPTGSVSVTWGDVLYHSDADLAGPSGGGLMGTPAFQYHINDMHRFTRRHIDNVGFSSGVQAPTWDEKRFPCVNGK